MGSGRLRSTKQILCCLHFAYSSLKCPLVWIQLAMFSKTKWVCILGYTRIQTGVHIVADDIIGGSKNMIRSYDKTLKELSICCNFNKLHTVESPWSQISRHYHHSRWYVIWYYTYVIPSIYLIMVCIICV